VQGQLNTQKETSFNPYSPADYEYQREKFHDFSQQDINNSIDQRVDDQISRAQQELDSQPKNTLYGKPVYLSVDPATLKAMNVENLQYVGNGTIVPVWHETINKGTPQETQVEKQGTPMKVEDWKMAEGKRNVGAKYFESKSKAQPQKSSSSTTVKSKRPPLDSYIKSK
jgi:hypothetical protein